MKKGFIESSFLVQIILIPIVWIIAILKILIAIPVLIIGKCNEIMENHYSDNNLLK